MTTNTSGYLGQTKPEGKESTLQYVTCVDMKFHGTGSSALRVMLPRVLGGLSSYA